MIRPVTYLRALLREAVATAWAQRLSTVIAALVVAAVCGVILATTGQAAAAEQRVLSRIDDAGTRLIVVEDSGGAAGISASSVDAVSRLGGVRWALGIRPVTDVRNAVLGRAGQPVPSHVVHGRLPEEIKLQGRVPEPGQALVSADGQRLLGLEHAAGGVIGSGIDAPVVGAFDARAPLDRLEGTTLIRAREDADGEVLRALFVMADDVDSVESLAAAVRLTISADEPGQVQVRTPQTVLDLRTVVAGELGRSGRQLMLLVLGVGLALVATTMFGAVSARRREFGRRRALGASRSAVVLIVAVHGLVAAALGAAAGTAAGLVAVHRVAGSLPSAGFTIGVALLSVLVAFVACLPPALLAAYRDPVRILRVP